MMGSIYERATGVLVWLGEDLNSDAKRAFELIEINDYHGDGYKTDEESVWYEWPSPPSSDESFLDPSRWKHLQALSQLPWFTRVWVLQEVGVAQTAVAYWGQSSLKFGHIVECFSLISHNPCFGHLITTYGNFFNDIVDPWEAICCTYDNKRTWRNECPHLRFYVNHPERQFLIVLWVGTRFTASVPHDYIYAHLGHPSARRADGEEFIKVDYSKSLGNLYLDVAERLIAQAQGILIPSAVYNTGNNNTTEPSWVPRWHQASEIGMIARMPGDDRCYNASLSESTEPKTSLTTGPEGGTRLLTRGIIFDMVKLSSVALDRDNTRCKD
ncbi:MAG: hypothetical protein L6R38_005105 [Xanthoria sp. 2 TBL-2021]|nr:MAG: hypothetical protein L6R38_005105 [Xanthoria sp. 2 TBL-2021]